MPIEMKVKAIAIDPKSNIPAVVLTDKDERRYLPIWIGVPEAAAIFTKLIDQKSPRPMTHDLLRNIISDLKYKVVEILIDNIEDNTFFAKIYLDGDKGRREVDARPSDAIALALRTGATIFVSEKVVYSAGVEDKDKFEKEAKQFKDLLKDMTVESVLREEKGEQTAPPSSPGPAEADEEENGQAE
jgi:bifunctional DNase/RNase